MRLSGFSTSRTNKSLGYLPAVLAPRELYFDRVVKEQGIRLVAIRTAPASHFKDTNTDKQITFIPGCCCQ